MRISKKVVAIILTIFILFSSMSVSISARSTNNKISEEVTTISEESFDFIDRIVDFFHNIVGGIWSIFGSECPFCSKLHKLFGTDEPKETYSLEVVPSFGGTVVNVSGDYEEGYNLEINAIADSGWEFTSWQATNGGTFTDATSAKTNFTMPNATTIVVAQFSKIGQTPLTEDEVAIYRAYYDTEILYSDGDFADSVTQKLELPTVYGSDDQTVIIEWSSSDENIINSEGNVSREAGENKTVILTANFSKGQASCKKEFTVTVIKANDISAENIHDNLVTDLTNLNQDASYELEIEYNDDNTQVEYISGSYSDILVDSVESALFSIYSVKSMLGLDNPKNQLEWLATNHDDTSLNYSFKQVHNNIEVYGCTVTVNAEIESGKTLSITSNIIKSETLNAVDCDASLSEEEISNILNEGETIKSFRKIIYASDKYYEHPILCYLVETENKKMVIDANTEEIVLQYDTVISFGDYSTTGKGKTEQGNMVTFPIQFHQWDWWFYYQEDVAKNIELEGGNHSPITREFNTEWNDKTANSAYYNVIKAYDYFYNKFGRRSVDNSGKKIIVNVHNEKCTDSDNAHSHGADGIFCFFDNSNGTLPTTAAGYDIAAHEYTHNVFANIINTEFPYSNETGSINEGYADIFACFADNDDWLVGEDWQTVRNIANPESLNCPSKISSPSYYTGGDQSILVHTNATVVSHAAYLMHSYGITGSKLEKLWYNSMSQGYNARSTFKTLRRNVIQAAKNNNFSDAELSKVRKAFDAVEIYDERCDLKLKLVDNQNNLIDINSNASILIQRTKYDVPGVSHSMQTILNPIEFKDIYFGEYTITIQVDGYVPFTGKINLLTNSSEEISVQLIKAGISTVSGTLTSATTAQAISGAAYSVIEGFNATEGRIVKSGITNSNGTYSFEIQAGYYTIIVSKDGYTTGNFNLTVDGGEAITNNLSISPIMSEENFRVVLTWGSYPSDLDSHLFGYPETGSNYHIYYSNKNAYINGNRVANLDVDDTTSFGPETTTFVADASSKYEYYIDWFYGSGTWATCNGKVEVYNGDRLVYIFDVPNVNSNRGSWRVFTIENGIFTAHNTIQSQDIY